jgi:hypothetical protein
MSGRALEMRDEGPEELAPDERDLSSPVSKWRSFSDHISYTPRPRGWEGKNTLALRRRWSILAPFGFGRSKLPPSG